MSATTGPSGASYTEKALTYTITLGTGQFGSTGMDTVTLAGLRSVVTIEKAGFPAMDRASIRIYGVQPTVMNQVSTLGIPLSMVRQNNTITLKAGDTVNGMATVYSGYMMQCWQDFSEVPETSLVINAFGGMVQAIQPVPPISFPGTADVATIMSGLATTMGLAFENNGVQVKLSNPYFSGSALEQAHAVARAANIEMYFDTGQPAPNQVGGAAPTGTLAIWPKTGTRSGQIPLISAASGLIGYPKFESNGMSFRTLYTPNLKLAGKIQMQSSVGAAASQAPASAGLPPGTQSGGPNGLWYVVAPLTHNLSAQLPGGPWFTDVHCVRVPGTPGAS